MDDDTSHRLLSPEGRFEERPNPGPLPYAMAPDGSLVPLAPSSVPHNGTHGAARVSGDAVPGSTRNHGAQATEPWAGASNGQHDVGTPDQEQTGHNGHPGGSQRMAGAGLTAAQARARRHMLDLVALCPPPDKAPMAAADVVKAFRQSHALQPPHIYKLARDAEQAKLVEITAVGSTRRLQFRRLPETQERLDQAGLMPGRQRLKHP